MKQRLESMLARASRLVLVCVGVVAFSAGALVFATHAMAQTGDDAESSESPFNIEGKEEPSTEPLGPDSTLDDPTPEAISFSTPLFVDPSSGELSYREYYTELPFSGRSQGARSGLAYGRVTLVLINRREAALTWEVDETTFQRFKNTYDWDSLEGVRSRFRRVNALRIKDLKWTSTPGGGTRQLKKATFEVVPALRALPDLAKQPQFLNAGARLTINVERSIVGALQALVRWSHITGGRRFTDGAQIEGPRVCWSMFNTKSTSKGKRSK